MEITGEKYHRFEIEHEPQSGVRASIYIHNQSGAGAWVYLEWRPGEKEPRAQIQTVGRFTLSEQKLAEILSIIVRKE